MEPAERATTNLVEGQKVRFSQILQAFPHHAKFLINSETKANTLPDRFEGVLLITEWGLLCKRERVIAESYDNGSHRRELALLESLVRPARRTMLREILVAEVYGDEEEPQSNALDALISRLSKH